MSKPLSGKFRGSSLALAVSLGLGSLAAYAEDKADEADAANKEDVEQIVVIGSRAAPRSVGDSAVPVDVISGEEFKHQGSTDMTSMLQNVVPSFNVNDQPINDASTLVRPANLRGMASDHTLVLVNGKRRHRSAVITFLGGGLSDGAQGPDISTIPAAALKRVEVLRDGAAAQYGSDAIAGVINFVLKDDSEGGLIDAHWGSYYAGDGDTFQVSGNIGMPLTDNGFANFSVEFREADPTSRSVQRDDAQGLIDGGNTAVANPAQIWGNPEIKDDIKFFANFGLDLGNDREAYMFGNYATREVDGGFYYRNPHTRGGVNAGPTVDGLNTLLVGDLTPDDGMGCPTVFLQQRDANGNITDIANVLTTAAFQQVAADPNCWAFNEMFPGGFTPRFGGEITDASIAIGTRGELANDVLYDISVYLGESEVDFSIRNTINPSMGPDTPTAFKPGRYTQTEKNFNIDLSKPVDFEGLDEAVNFAGGFQYRHETYDSIAGDPASYEIGPLASQGFGIGSNGFPGLSARSQNEASRHNIAFYLDIEANLTDQFLLTGAVRYEDYSDFGNTTKGKVSARYELSDAWALRGAYSTGFKAPTVGQSNVRNVTTAFGTDGRLIDRATLPPTDPISVQKGGTELQPEESKSLSFGIVGEFDNGLFLTVDYYDIELTDRISTTSGIKLTPDDIAALLAQGVRDASSFTEVSYFTNDFDTTTQGVDLVASYTQDMFGGETKYALAYNWTSTEVDEHSDNISADRVRMLEDNLPPVRYSVTANHFNGPWRFLGRVSYAGKIFEDHLDSGLPMTADSEFTVDVEAAYSFSENLNLTVGAKNLLDEFPDEAVLYDTEVAGSRYPTTSPIGINGGFYYLRAVYSF